MNKNILPLLLLPVLMGCDVVPKRDEISDEVLREYELILQKKSGLSASERRRIVRLVESTVK